MPDPSDWLHNIVGISPASQKSLLVSLVVILLLWLLRWLLLRIFERRVEDWRQRYYWRKFSAYIAVFLGILVIGRIWSEGFQSISTFLGLLTAGLAIALRDPVVNLAGWAFILWRRPFEAGDRIQLGEQAGDVIDIRIFQFTLLEIGNWVQADQSTGRIIHVPNGKIFSETLANYDKGFKYIWNELAVLVTFESNWRQAKEILQSIVDSHEDQLSEVARKRLRRASEKFLIYYSKLTPIVYTSVEDSGVLLTIRYLCEPRRRRSTAEVLWEEILVAFGNRTDIDFAYPTRRFYNNALEGKAATRAPEV